MSLPTRASSPNLTLMMVSKNCRFLTRRIGWYLTKTRAAHPEEITKTSRELFEVNVIGNIHLFNLFMPLVLKGEAKKVITISSGFADPDLTRNYDIGTAPLYSVSKAAVNMVVAKFSAEYREEGVLFLALTPGTVDVGQYKDGMPPFSLVDSLFHSLPPLSFYFHFLPFFLFFMR